MSSESDSKFDQRTGTPDQEDSKILQRLAVDADSPLERALARLRVAIEGKIARERERRAGRSHLIDQL